MAEDTNFLTKMTSIGVVGDSTLTAQMNYQAQLGATSSVISSFDVQTVAKTKDERCKIGNLSSVYLTSVPYSPVLYGGFTL